MTKDLLNTLVCIKCGSNLSHGQTSLECKRCNREYHIINGIPHFLTEEIYWSEPGLTQETMAELLAKLESGNWHDLLQNHENEDARRHYFFISNLDRGNWHHMLNLPRDSKIMDLGAGMGTITHALSGHYNHVVAIEPVAARCEFMKHRFRQDGVDNVTIIRGDSEHIPFPKGSFDHIVLNGVLEWIPYSYKGMNPRKAQTFVVGKLRHLLKPGGSISVGIENRFYYGFFSGYPDCHIGVKFATILPRMLAHALCRMKIGDIYRPYLYSWLGLRRLLRKAGFTDVTVYASLPSYNEPLCTIPLTAESEKYEEHIWPTHNKNALRIKKALVKLGILKYFGFAFRVVGISRD